MGLVFGLFQVALTTSVVVLWWIQLGQASFESVTGIRDDETLETIADVCQQTILTLGVAYALAQGLSKEREKEDEYTVAHGIRYRPHRTLVFGAPASGKTTLAEPLRERLAGKQLPLTSTTRTQPYSCL